MKLIVYWNIIIYKFSIKDLIVCFLMSSRNARLLTMQRWDTLQIGTFNSSNKTNGKHYLILTWFTYTRHRCDAKAAVADWFSKLNPYNRHMRSPSRWQIKSVDLIVIHFELSAGTGCNNLWIFSRWESAECYNSHFVSLHFLTLQSLLGV